MTTPQIKQEYIAPEDPEPESATSDEQERAGDGKDWREKWRVDGLGNDRSTANIRLIAADGELFTIPRYLLATSR